MYDNLVFQDVSKLLISDIRHNQLPGAVLFSGPDASGKLTAALETARILSCTGENRGSWQCTCRSCLQQKSLTFSNLMLMGPRDCFLEIASAKKAFLEACSKNASYLNAARYLFLRSIRKLTLRFNGILWYGENNISKISSLLEDINENLEMLDFPRELPSTDETVKICESLAENSLKLESDFMYNTIPINQIRNMEQWAHIKSDEGKKTIIIENADRMLTNVRNALLKLLEEPPADCLFILLTSNKNAILPTVLSRLRVYSFKERNEEQQAQVISRVFHSSNFSGKVSDYLLNFLPVSPQIIKQQALIFYKSIINRELPDIELIVKECGSFKPKIVLNLFLNSIIGLQKNLLITAAGCEVSVELCNKIRLCLDSINSYNQNAKSALEALFKDLSALNVRNGMIISRTPIASVL